MQISSPFLAWPTNILFEESSHMTEYITWFREYCMSMKHTASYKRQRDWKGVKKQE